MDLCFKDMGWEGRGKDQGILMTESTEVHPPQMPEQIRRKDLGSSVFSPLYERRVVQPTVIDLSPLLPHRESYSLGAILLGMLITFFRKAEGSFCGFDLISSSEEVI